MSARDEARAALIRELRDAAGDTPEDVTWEEDLFSRAADMLTLLDEPVPADEREALIELIDGCIPDDIPGYRQRYTDKAADAILAASFRRQGPITDVREARRIVQAALDDPLTQGVDSAVKAAQIVMALEAAEAAR